jgi:hypothetical protein
MKYGIGFLLLIGLAACGDVVGPETPLDLRIEAFPRTVAPGDSVTFIAFAYNPTNETIELDSGCGLSLDVSIRTPDGNRISVYEEMFAGAVPTCQHMWYHEADPGELIELEFSWEAPSKSGEYRAATSIRCRDGQCPKSETVRITVR